MNNMKPACAPGSGVDHRIFFRPDAGEDPTGYRTWSPFEAQYVCLGCPIRIACRDAARERDEQHGVWGGEEFGPKPRLAEQATLPGMPGIEIRVCQICANDFRPYNKQHLYCNDLCKTIAHSRRCTEKNRAKRARRAAQRASAVSA